MRKIIVAGIGTEVGKTVVSAILTTALNADYWKPVQCGSEDSIEMQQLIDIKRHTIHPSAYSLKAPLSPHHAARLENISINCERITLPETSHPLIIEMAGGIFVPLKIGFLSIDLFQKWNCEWVIVSKHYLGSINHTLLTIDALKSRGIPILGVIFNGSANPDTEKAILTHSRLPYLGSLFPEKQINKNIIQGYAKKWQKLL